MDLSSIQPLLDWIAKYPAIAGLVICFVAALESLAVVGILIPGIVFMLGVGTLVGLGALPLYSTLFWAAAGAIIGDGFSYWLGRHFDRQLRHVWPLSRYPKLIPKGERFFRKHGGASILFGRFVGPLRPVIPAVAGIMHMNVVKFYAINVVSAVLWSPTVILPGVVFGESLQLASDVVYRLALFAVFIVLFFGLIAYVLNKAVGLVLEDGFETITSVMLQRYGLTNLFSVAFTLMLVLAMGFFVTRIDSELTYVEESKNITYESWQTGFWKQFNPSSVERLELPVTLQWWGTLLEVESGLKTANWQQARRMQLQNLLYYFTPQVSRQMLPVLSVSFQNSNEVILMVKRREEQEEYHQLLRLWQVDASRDKADSQLWVGTVELIAEWSFFDIVRVPYNTGRYADALKIFQKQFSYRNSPVQWVLQLYPQADISEQWRGEVLLISSKDN